MRVGGEGKKRESKEGGDEGKAKKRECKDGWCFVCKHRYVNLYMNAPAFVSPNNPNKKISRRYKKLS